MGSKSRIFSLGIWVQIWLLFSVQCLLAAKSRPTLRPTIVQTQEEPNVPQANSFPTLKPTRKPTIKFSSFGFPTRSPISTPRAPTRKPTFKPTVITQTRAPTAKPVSRQPTTIRPSTAQSMVTPTVKPTFKPSALQSTRSPTLKPVTPQPTLFPTRIPTAVTMVTPQPAAPVPTAKPVAVPTLEPTFKPTVSFPSTMRFPTRSPISSARFPTRKPTSNRFPTTQPTLPPTTKPTSSPTPLPTFKIQSSDPKHIILFIVDDLGWDDVGFHGNSQIPTPFINSLAKEGVIIDRHYVQPICAPSRAALLTGRNPIHTSLFDNRFLGLKRNFTLLPHHLSRLGYSCHLVGKWHLGDATWDDTPLSRGFHTSFGSFSGSGDHYAHNYENQNLLDLWDQTTPRFDLSCWDGNLCPNNTYFTHLITQRAIKIIDESKNSNSPIFLLVSFTAPHFPYQAPQDVIDLYNETIEHPLRRTYAAMIHILDNAIQNITMALERNGMRNDSIFIFTSDNGAMADISADGTGGGIGSNWPLRGTKRTLWEGGVRVPAFISGAGILPHRRGQTLTGLFHVTDWLPTLLTMAAKQINLNWNWEDIITYDTNEPTFSFGDGVDQWAYLTGESNETLRTELLLETHSLGSDTGTGNALIVGDWKIILRTSSLWPAATNINSNDGWFGGPNSSDPILGSYGLPRGVETQPYSIQCPSPPVDFTSSYQCLNKPGTQLDQKSYACLFNLATDPCEQVDLSLTRPGVLQAMWNKLAGYRQDVYEYPCTRCGGDYICPSDHTVSLSCSDKWYDGSSNCQVNMPC